MDSVLDLPRNQQITQPWNGSYTQTGPNVQVQTPRWNATIAPNGSSVSLMAYP